MRRKQIYGSSSITGVSRASAHYVAVYPSADVIEPQKRPQGVKTFRSRSHASCWGSTSRSRGFRWDPQAGAMGLFAWGQRRRIFRGLNTKTGRNNAPYIIRKEEIKGDRSPSFIATKGAERIAVAAPLLFRAYFDHSLLLQRAHSV